MDGSPLTFRSEPCDAVDPLQVFAAAGAAPRFYWEQPAAGRFCVGIGCAARLTVKGHDRFRAADELARETFGRIRWEGPGPRISHLVGGFAFAPAQSTNGLWQGLTAAANFNVFSNAFTHGNQPSLSLTKYFGTNFLGGVQVGRNTYDFRAENRAVTNDWIKLQSETYLTRQLYGSAYFESYKGDSPSLNRLFLEMGVRF